MAAVLAIIASVRKRRSAATRVWWCVGDELPLGLILAIERREDGR